MRTVTILLMVLLLGACAPQPSVPPSSTATPQTGDTVINADPTPSNTVDTLTTLAVQDLANRLSLDTGMIHVISTETQLWPDSSLGCPQPGGIYTKQTVPGYRLRLEANGQDFFYHTDESGTVILCEEGNLPSFPVTPGEIDDGQPWMPVD